MSPNETKKRFSVAELFCGCGGFSHGFALTGRFDVVFGNDVKIEALETFRYNHKDIQGNPPKINPNDIREVSINEIENCLLERNVKKGELDCLIGGPPCQGFSQMRRSYEREGSEIVKFKGYDRLAHDPRNDLVLRFLEIAQALRPKVIVIENVPQMLKHGFNGVIGGLANAIREILSEEMGYSVNIGVLNAANYGVPQLRERLIILASRIGAIPLPKPSFFNGNGQNTNLLGNKKFNTVKDAIFDLPEPSKNKDTFGGYPLNHYPNVKDFSDFAITMRSKTTFPYNHITRSYSDQVHDIIKHMLPGETWNQASERMREDYEKIIHDRQKSNGDLSYEEIKKYLIHDKVINPVFYKNYYWSAYTRLLWEKPALTITANANFLGSGRFTHPIENRGITMREAARLQSFDDDFLFITSLNDAGKTERIGVGMDMIGEAVPPFLSKAIAEQILFSFDADE